MVSSRSPTLRLPLDLSCLPQMPTPGERRLLPPPTAAGAADHVRYEGSWLTRGGANHMSTAGLVACPCPGGPLWPSIRQGSLLSRTQMASARSTVTAGGGVGRRSLPGRCRRTSSASASTASPRVTPMPCVPSRRGVAPAGVRAIAPGTVPGSSTSCTPSVVARRHARVVVVGRPSGAPLSRAGGRLGMTPPLPAPRPLPARRLFRRAAPRPARRPLPVTLRMPLRRGVRARQSPWTPAWLVSARLVLRGLAGTVGRPRTTSRGLASWCPAVTVAGVPRLRTVQTLSSSLSRARRSCRRLRTPFRWRWWLWLAETGRRCPRPWCVIAFVATSESRTGTCRCCATPRRTSSCASATARTLSGS